MARPSWTKDWTYYDDDGGETTLKAVDIKNIQDDIDTIVDNLEDDNIHPEAGIVETKVSFDTGSGHAHTGSDSRLLRTIAREYRVGTGVYVGSLSEIVVTAGVVDINGKTMNLTTDKTLDVSDTDNWVEGTEAASTQIYIYAFDDDNTLNYKLSDEAPDVRGDSDTFIYQIYGSVYYRCVGGAYNDANSDLERGTATSFDLTNMMIGFVRGEGADFTVNTIWTPEKVTVIYGSADSSPANGEEVDTVEVSRRMLTDLSLNWKHGPSDNHQWEGLTVAGTVNNITQQAAGTAGSFTMDNLGSDQYAYFWAISGGHHSSAE